MERRRLLDAAKVFLLECLSDKQIYTPCDFDKNILGLEGYKEGLKIIIEFKAPIWNGTIFCKALGELVDENKIEAWRDDEGWKYQIK